MKGNWVKVHRKLLANPIMSHDGLTRLWLYCILKANWKDRKWLIPGTTEEVLIVRGAFVTGRAKLHQNLYGPKYKGDKASIPSDRTLWRWLKSLEKMGCVHVQNVSNRFSMVSVCKYSTYQKLDKPKCPTSVQPLSNPCPTDVQLVSTREEGLKEGNKEGRKKVITYTQDFEDFWKSYPKRQGNPPQGKANAFDQWQKLPPDDLPQVMLALNHYTKTCNGYPKDPERFLKKDFWKDHLTPPSPASNYANNKSRNGSGQIYDPSTVLPDC